MIQLIETQPKHIQTIITNWVRSYHRRMIDTISINGISIEYDIISSLEPTITVHYKGRCTTCDSDLNPLESERGTI